MYSGCLLGLSNGEPWQEMEGRESEIRVFILVKPPVAVWGRRSQLISG